jgi:hypothetical protein
MKYLLWDEGRGNMLAYRAFATRFLQPCPTCGVSIANRAMNETTMGKTTMNKATMNKATMNKTAENA